MTAVRVSAEFPLVKDLLANVSHLQDIQYNRHNLSQIGLNYQLNKQQRIYVREEFAKYEERNESRTVFGAESLIGKNTVAFEEYRLAGGVEGSRSQQSLGLRNKFMLGNQITGNLTLEKLSTMRGNARSSEPDAFAVATGLEYLPLSTLKITSRLEYRQEFSATPQNSWLGEINAACKLHPDYTLIIAERYFYNEFKYEGERITTRTSLGLAYRPLMHDRFNALVKVELKHETNTIKPQNTVSDAYLFALEGVFQANRYLQIIGKYAGKVTDENGFDAYTDLFSGRVLYDITKQIDVGAEYRLLTSHATHSIYQGGAAEIGYRVVDGVWLSAGYSFDRFDADLACDSYTGDGPFIRLRIKFDENSLNKIRKNR